MANSDAVITDHSPPPSLTVGVTEGDVLSLANMPDKQRGLLLVQVRMKTVELH